MRRITAVAAFLAALSLLSACGPTGIGQMTEFEKKEQAACFIGRCFDVELAVTPEQHEKGLMGRKSLRDSEGMLFVFEPEGNYEFWMRHTLIPLDIIWLNRTGHVLYIWSNAQPCTKDSCPIANIGRNSKYVLEINAGLAEELGIEDGSLIKISLDG